MPMHDWTRVEAGIYHAFHHSWIEEIARALNRGVLPDHFYALPEQQAAGFGPDVLTLHDETPPAGVVATATKPKATLRFETANQFYARKKKVIGVRHATGDRLIALVEILSPANKKSSAAVQAFVEKANEFLSVQVSLLLVDPLPPTRRAPHGIHAAIFAESEDYQLQVTAEQPLLCAAYEAGPTVRGYIETLAVGDPVPDMPLFLAPGLFVEVPLEQTYMSAWDAVPKRWRDVIAPPSN